ncbi:MAG: adenosylcobinamide-phosphate synthase, partial [Solirubrobacteraceae bacterium]|nr:adenosylcobinamide-phosphate synthase [Solirubrobacteraceae bacterium]
MSAGALLGGYAADLVLGDPARRHPVAGFGRLALRVERAVYAPTRRRGAAYALGLTALAALAGEALARAARRAGLGRGAALLVLTWAALGGRSLAGEARRIGALLEAGDLDAARALCEAMKHESQFMHDLLVDGVAGLISFVKDELGDEGVERAWTYSLERSWKGPVTAIDKTDRREIAKSLAATWRAHSTSGV